MIRHQTVTDCIQAYKQYTLSDYYHKQGEQLKASIAINKKVLWFDLNTLKRLGYNYK